MGIANPYSLLNTFYAAKCAALCIYVFFLQIGCEHFSNVNTEDRFTGEKTEDVSTAHLSSGSENRSLDESSGESSNVSGEKGQEYTKIGNEGSSENTRNGGSHNQGELTASLDMAWLDENKLLGIGRVSDEVVAKMLFGGFYRDDLQGGYEFKLSELPIKGGLRKIDTPYLWPDEFGGLAHRRRALTRKNKFGYKLFEEVEVYNLESTVFSSLSAAEKFDIYGGEFDYPTVASEFGRTAVLKSLHGHESHQQGFIVPDFIDLRKYVAAVLSLGNYDVSSKLAMSSSNLSLFFSYDEIVGLAALHFYMNSGKFDFLGSSCDFDFHKVRDTYFVKYMNAETYDFEKYVSGLRQFDENSKCQPYISPAVFHLILANELGFDGEKRRIVIENIDDFFTIRGLINDYEMKYTNRSTREVDVSVQISLTIFGDQSGKELTYVYTLQLDDDGRIVGGRWLSKPMHAFLWSANSFPEATGTFSRLNELFRKKSIVLPVQGRKRHPNKLKNKAEKPTVTETDELTEANADNSQENVEDFELENETVQETVNNEETKIND